MAWTYDFYTSSSSATQVIESMQRKLTQLTNNESATAKVGHSDVKGGSARGTVIFNSKAGAPPAYNLTGGWNQRTWSFKNGDDYKTTIQAVCDCLNGKGEEVLTEVEAAYAKFSVSDTKEGTCHMALFWQSAN